MLNPSFVADAGFRPRWPDETEEGHKNYSQLRKWYVFFVNAIEILGLPRSFGFNETDLKIGTEEVT